MKDILKDMLIVDNFAGGGGTSTGIEMALGRPVDIAINHDPKALAMHRINHPTAEHYEESVWDVDPIEVTKGKPVGIVWLSPDCKHFSKAKGGKPVNKNIRGLAWVGLRWVALKKPILFFLENVTEFQTWGDLGEDGKPCPKRKGRTFNSFVNALKRHGYHVEYRELRACDYGAPTIRKRFVLVARRDGLPIVWPDPTHKPITNNLVQNGILKPHRLAAECIDWSIPCPSIFTRKKPLAKATMERVAAGIKKFVIDHPDPFIVDCKAPVLTECANASSKRSMPINEPLRTICAETKGGHHAIIISHLSKMKNNCIGQDVLEPFHALTTVNQFAEVRAFLTAYYGSEKEGNSINEPLRTIPTKDRFGLVTVNCKQYQITDIGFRMLKPKELYKAQGFPDNYIFTHGIDASGKKIKLTQTDQTRMVGNSVPPDLAEAIVRANVEVMSIKQDVAA